MTISNQQTYVSYAGAGLAGPFPVPFPFGDNSELVAVKIDADGARSILTGNTITGAGSSSGELYTADFVAVGETLLIYRATALTQLLDYIAADSFPAESHEAALDRLTRIAQDARRDIDRGLRAPIGETLAELPDAATRAGMIQAYDETGQPVADQSLADFKADIVASLDITSEAVAIIEAAAEDAEVDAVAEIQSAGSSQTALVNAAGLAWANALGVSGGLFDVIPASEGYDTGFAMTDAAGWTTDAWRFSDDGNVGSVVRLKIPGADFSAVSGAYRIAVQPQFPAGGLWFHDMREGEGQFVPNLIADIPSSFSGNLFAYPTGDIRNASGGTTPAITKFYDGAAARLLYGTTAQVFYFVSSGTTAPGATPPAGNYWLTFEVKSNTGASQNARLGSLTSPSAENNIVITTSYQEFSYNWTAGGSDYGSITLRGDGSNQLDVSIKNIRLEQSAISGAYDETRDWSVRRRSGFAGGLLYDADGALDNVTGNGTALAGGYGFVTSPWATTAVAAGDGEPLTEYTALALFKQTTAGTTQVVMSTEADTGLGTTTTSLSIGVSSDGKLSSQPISLTGANDLVITGKGYLTVTVAVKPGERAVYINGVLARWANTATFNPIKLRNNVLLGGSATSTQLKGKIGGDFMADAFYDSDDVIQLHQKLDYQFAASPLARVVPDEWIFAVGDSRTAAASPSGDSYADLIGIGNQFDSATKQAWFRNCAQSGYGSANILAMISANNPTAALPVGPGGIAQRVAEALASGTRAIVVCGPVGINDNAALVADPSNYFTTQVLPIWQAIRATGALLVVCTELNAAGITGWDAARQAYNDIIRDATTQYDALADIGSVNIGYYGDGINGANWYDTIHPTAAGHLLLFPEMVTALESVGV